MRNISKFLIIIVAFSVMIIGCTSSNMINLNNISKNLNYNEVKDSLIRFHVIANSDTNEDQNLKLQVRNGVINYLYPYLSESKSLDESREIIKSKMDEVKEISEKIVKENNYTYDIDVQLSKENFPEKSYGNITLPQGNYEAFRIVIGNGEGKNWWCVMFPPLCFVDESKAKIEYDKTQDKIQEQVKKNNLKKSNEYDLYKDVKIKFKVIEVVNNLFK